MKNRTQFLNRIVALLAVALVGSLAWTGCSHEKEYVDEDGPTTGEIEVEDDETEYEVEKELPEDESRATGETEMETEHGWVEVEVEEDEIEIEGEKEFPEGDNPAYTGEGGEEKVDIQIGRPEPAKAVSVTKVYTAPVDYIGSTVIAQAKVNKVMSDRGFWVKSGDNKVFAVVREDVPQKEMIDINKGQTIRFMGLMVDGDDWNMLAGDLEEETKQTLKEQPYFLAVHWKHIKMVDGTTKTSMK